MKILITHPDNVPEIAAAMQKAMCDHTLDVHDFFRANQFKLQTNKLINKRDVRDVFVPPYDPFVEYEKTDEPWMQALGMGETKQIDFGILMYMMDEPKLDFDMPIMEPSWPDVEKFHAASPKSMIKFFF